MLERDTFELVVQVNGKVRDRSRCRRRLPRRSWSRARARPSRCRRTWTARSRASVVVPGKLVNLVV